MSRLCAKCRTSEEDACCEFDEQDGWYCCECWWGYQLCADSRCEHYQIEHGFGDTNKIIYSRDHPEQVGQSFTEKVGCMNAGCPCGEFQGKPNYTARPVRAEYGEEEEDGISA